MSWNILPKNVLQYFLTKLKGLMYTKTEVDNLIPSITPNPSTTTDVLNGLEIDGTAYEIQGSGEPNVQADWNEVDSTADDYIKNKPTIPTVTADGAKQGVGVDSGQYRANLVKYSQLNYLCGEHAYSGDVSDRTYEIILDQAGRLCVIIPWDSFVKSDWNATSGKAEILNKPSLATVATSGSYNDLSNKPTIPDISTKVSKSGDTMSGMLDTTYKVGTWVGSLTKSAINLSEATGSFGGLISAPTKNGRIALATYQGNDDKLYIGYGEKGRTTNSYTRSIAWNGATGKLEADITGNAEKLNGYASDTAATANTIVRRQANGYIYAVHYNASCGNENISSYSNPTVGFFSTDGWLRKTPLANFKTTIGLNKDVPSNAVFTDTNNAVTQNDNNGNNWNLRLLLSGSQDDTTRTQGCYKTRNLQYNDYWKALYIGNVNRQWGMIYAQGNQQLNISASAEENYRLFLGVRESTWSLAPLYNQYLKLGTGSFKWGQIYSSSATINTSDRRKKKDIQPLDENARIFVMKLNPVSYKMKDGETGRTHYGMIAQDIEDELTELGMTAMDFAGFCKDEVYENVKTTREGFTEVKTVKKPGEYIYGLRYEEFIAPLIKTVQLQQQEIEELKHRIDILEEK